MEQNRTPEHRVVQINRPEASGALWRSPVTAIQRAKTLAQALIETLDRSCGLTY